LNAVDRVHVDRSRFGGHPDEIAAAPEHRRLTDGFDPEKLHR
jgi:hypothetical protein